MTSPINVPQCPPISYAIVSRSRTQCPTPSPYRHAFAQCTARSNKRPIRRHHTAAVPSCAACSMLLYVHHYTVQVTYGDVTQLSPRPAARKAGETVHPSLGQASRSGGRAPRTGSVRPSHLPGSGAAQRSLNFSPRTHTDAVHPRWPRCGRASGCGRCGGTPRR
ncbi:hypothetical protein BC628DRAFT_535113 [Trametes gibbosa]|nr:hypothetical protein BC628DRAFT_535113 [Trametes gibbosa]